MMFCIRVCLFWLYIMKVIKKVCGSYFGAAYGSYREAVELDNSARPQDVKDYLIEQQR